VTDWNGSKEGLSQVEDWGREKAENTNGIENVDQTDD
jgi:hypothetical protein